MEHTLLVSVTALECYADTRNSEEVIPELIALLVKESAPDLTECRIPYGDAVNQPGWDGLVTTASGFRQFLPAGQSFWEIGTSATPQVKATKDFKGRTRSATPEARGMASYIFVTPRCAATGGWTEPSQRRWIQKRKKFGWSAIRLLDAVQIAEWLREFPAIGKWLLKKMGAGVRAAGFTTPAEHWAHLESLKSDRDPGLPPAIFLLGREQAQAALARLFHGDTRQILFGVESQLDAEDFVAAYLASLPEDTRTLFGNRCLFINDAETWLSFAGLRAPHILVAHPKLDLEAAGEELHMAAMHGGHSVIIAVNSEVAGGAAQVVALRSPSASTLEISLVNNGYTSDRARELSAAGALSLASLKRHLRGLGDLPPYATWGSARVLAQANLGGRWSGDNPADRAAMETILGKSYGEWIETLRPEALRSDTPLSQLNNNWKVLSRGEAWSALGPRVSDDDLERLRVAALVVLGEPDPKFSLPREQRHLAGAHGQVLRHSRNIRQGVAETLALLGSRPAALSTCSLGKAEAIATSIVRDLLFGADWGRWASLDSLLPLLAEAAPEAFLEAVESALSSPSSSPFLTVFAQEDSGVLGWNYTSGLLWALETLAWSAHYLSRATVLLGELASIDPGGKWANRPSSSLTDIFLPWHPQTTASIPLRKVAVETLLREQPAVGWKLLLSLVPRAQTTTTGTRRPTWRTFVPDDWSDTVSMPDYITQVEGYADLATQKASSDLSALRELVDRLPDLPRPAFERVLHYLSSSPIISSPDADRLPLWEALVDLAAHHKHFHDAHWAMPPESVANVERVAHLLAPSSLCLVYRRLFSDRDPDLLDATSNYEEQLRRLAARRQRAVREILRDTDLTTLLDFATQVASPEKVGEALGSLNDPSLPSPPLPEMLRDTQGPHALFLRGYVWARFATGSWQWIEQLPVNTWTADDAAALFAILPFTRDTWTRATHLLSTDVHKYWTQTGAHPWSASDPHDLLEALDPLLSNGRPLAAIRCLRRLVASKLAIAPDIAIRALQNTLSSDEQRYATDSDNIVDIIEQLQDDATADQSSLARIEWSYLTLLDPLFGHRPATLERQLSQEPSLFADLIKLIYRSDRDDNDSPAPKEQAALAVQGYRLLDAWATVPGTRQDGTIDGNDFDRWVAEAKRLVSASGHLKIAMNKLGAVLAHARPDPDGLWISVPVATLLNGRDEDAIRDGFITGVYNMRGVHYGTAGQEERALAQQFHDKADLVEQRGFHRLAASLRKLANVYEHEGGQAARTEPYEE